MMAALIAAVSLAALAQVFVSYCRSVLASARKVELSARVAGPRSNGYGLLLILGRVIGALNPRVSIWTEHERQGCSHFAAAVLDRCISSSRSLFTQQASDRL